MMSNLLPPNATQFERQFSTAFARISEIETPARTFNVPLKAPAAVLPWLAWERSVDDWKKNWSEEQKRQTIDNAYYVHAHKGTIGALERSLDTLGFKVKVQEWFATSPLLDPYTFKLHIEVDQIGVNQKQLKDLKQVANNNKNLRSRLLETSLTINSNASTQISSTTLSGHEFDFDRSAGGLYLDGTWRLDGEQQLNGVQYG